MLLKTYILQKNYGPFINFDEILKLVGSSQMLMVKNHDQRVNPISHGTGLPQENTDNKNRC